VNSILGDIHKGVMKGK
jgi:hypothetical protein